MTVTWRQLAASTGTTGETSSTLGWVSGIEAPGAFVAIRAQLASYGRVSSIDQSIVVATGAIAIIAVVSVLLLVRGTGTQRESRSVENQSSHADHSILTDRERVLELVDSNGGRMKQAAIVESVEWSKAKVSRLLADLEADEEIIKLRLGRENLICRPGNEPAASRTPGPELQTDAGEETPADE